MLFESDTIDSVSLLGEISYEMSLKSNKSIVVCSFGVYYSWTKYEPSVIIKYILLLPL